MNAIATKVNDKMKRTKKARSIFKTRKRNIPKIAKRVNLVYVLILNRNKIGTHEMLIAG